MKYLKVNDKENRNKIASISIQTHNPMSTSYILKHGVTISLHVNISQSAAGILLDITGKLQF